MPTPCTILVTDANQRSALAVTRSLGRLPDVRIITTDNTSSALAGSSRHSETYIQSPAPSTEPAQFIEWLHALAIKEQIDWVFPVTEITSQLLLLQRGKLNDIKLPFANYDVLMSLADKWRLTQLADRLDVPYPASELIAPGTLLTQLPNQRFPIVLKPCLSRIWTGTEWISTAVQIAHSVDELNEIYSSTSYFREHPFMLQEFIPGHGAGVFALYDNGRPITFFAHNRLREKPPGGGVSVLSESAALDPQLHAMAKSILDAANWHGVAMVEFRIAPGGKPYLMEVNTRFWGSLQLAIDSGVDFPALLLKISRGESVTAITSYRIGQRLRWLLGDLDSLYLVLRDPNFSLRYKVKRLAAFSTPQFFKTRHEINRVNDLGPAWLEFKHYIKALRH